MPGIDALLITTRMGYYEITCNMPMKMFIYSPGHWPARNLRTFMDHHLCSHQLPTWLLQIYRIQQNCLPIYSNIYAA